MSREGALWWIADDAAEATRFKQQIEAVGGHSVVITQYDDTHHDVMFQMDREVAVREGWASSVDSEEWLDEDDTTPGEG